MILHSSFCVLRSSFICLLLATSLHADFRIHPGFSPTWTDPTFNDSSWRTTDFHDVHDLGEVTLRDTFDLTKMRRVPGHPTALYVAGMFSHEVWWDGVLVGRGGVVGKTPALESPGPIESHYVVPEHLTGPGMHTVVVRSSAWHRGFSPMHGYWTVMAGEYDAIVDMRKWSANLALIALSGIVMTAIFALALFFLTGREPSFLILGALCVAAGGLLMAEAWRALFGYTYDWHIVRLRCVLSLSWLTGMLLVALLVSRFPHRFGRVVLIATGIIATAVIPMGRGWDQKSLYVFVVTVSVAFAWTIFAAVRRLHGSVLALVGTSVAALALAVQPFTFVDFNGYFAFDFLFVCLLCSHALEVRRTQQETNRLQLEIVRRHLQPHFLMNTLTALAEWIEQEPKTAVRMIESLSEEVRILAEMSHRRVVSAEDELRLCRSHLANMSLRKEVAYELQVDGIEDDRPVPPAVFHTLVENAITHGGARGGRVTMHLSARTDRDRVRYVFEAPAGDATDKSVCPTNGTGTRYIEARLREAWGDAWSFRQFRAGAMWRAEIEVPA